jgi:hypothetical protein
MGATPNRIAGTAYLKKNGVSLEMKGNWDYSLGLPKNEGMTHTAGVAGYKQMPQIPYLEGELIDRSDLSLKDLCETDGATITLELANGKIIVFRNAWYASDGKAGTEEANITTRFEARQAEEVKF